MPFARPTPQTLRDRIMAEVESALPGSDPRLRRSVEGVLARALAIASHELHGHLDWTAEQVLVDTADAEHLERHASIWGIERKPAAPAGGIVRFAGTEGAVVAAGAIVRRSDGIQFVLEADVVIGAAGTADATVTAIVAGAAGNTAAGVRLALVASVAGVEGQATVQDDGSGGGLAGGADAENDSSLRTRVLERIQQPPHGGALRDYRVWALEVPGVTRAWVYPLWMGIGTVGVTFVMDDKPGGPIPTASEVDAVAAHIDPLRPVTAEPIVFAPTPMAVDFTIELDPDTAATRAAVEAELRDFLRREAEPGGTLKASRLREAISAAGGEFSHVLAAPAGDVVAGAGEMPVMGVIIWAAP